MSQSMLGQGNPLAVVENQLQVLSPAGSFETFEKSLARHGMSPLRPRGLGVLQMNIGKMCNQTCKHCHVDAGPDRTEIMTRETMELCLAALARTEIGVVDITGGSPEMNPHFRWLVEKIKKLDRDVIDRCNLTILLAPRYEDIPQFLANHGVQIVASLPFYTADAADSQRGEGVFAKSIEALLKLNAVGYGQPGGKLKLTLVYNPTGAFLPPRQEELESTYRQQMSERYGIVFSSLITITNQPINRFLEYLLRSGNYETYMEQLIQAYNPSAVEGVMCRQMLSVGWDGVLYDCDFNQMLEMRLQGTPSAHIRDFDPDRLLERTIRTGLHCYACTAGQGSSCTGATA